MNSYRWVQALVLLLVCSVSSCYVRPKQSPLAGAYYRSPQGRLADVRRVALVAVDNQSGYADIADDVSESLYISLQRKQRFGISTVAQEDPLWRGLLLEPDGSYGPEELTRMRDALNCDAVLSGSITEYRPFPHLAMGLRLSLVDLDDGHLIWAIEHVWHADDLADNMRVASYLKTMPGKKTLEAEILRMSPTEFISFIAYEVAETISDPERQANR
jgi:hypothetical protein